MKNAKYLLLIFTFSLVGWQPYTFKTHKNQDNLKGPVKKVIEYGWDFGDKKIVVKDYNTQGHLIQLKEFGLSTFDDSIVGGSFPVEIKSLTDTNKLNLHYTRSWTYSNTGNLLTFKVINNLKQEETFRSILFYDKSDSLIKVNEITNDSIESIHIIYHLELDTIVKTVINNQSDTIIQRRTLQDKEGQIELIISKYFNRPDCEYSEVAIFNEFGKLHIKSKIGIPEFDFETCYDKHIENIFNGDSQLVKTAETSKTLIGETRKETFFQYDSLGSITKDMVFWYEDNNIEAYSEVKYDENQNRINWFYEEYYIDSNSYFTSSTRERYEYIYDSNKNWTEMKVIRDGKLNDTFERIIEYH